MNTAEKITLIKEAHRLQEEINFLESRIIENTIMLNKATLNRDYWMQRIDKCEQQIEVMQSQCDLILGELSYGLPEIKFAMA